MTLPFALPPWLPWWASLVLLVVGLLWVLAFLMVPFSVIGVKARLEGLEARLDELHAEIRTLALRLPEAGPVTVAFDAGYTQPLGARGAEAPGARGAEAPGARGAEAPGARGAEAFGVLRRPPVPPVAPLTAPPRREMDAPPPPRPPRREGRIEPHLDRGR